jgi:hypothetical protein
MFEDVHVGMCTAVSQEGGPEMLLMLLALLIILIIAGAGFALHVLWWVAIAALVIWLIGAFVRRV